MPPSSGCYPHSVTSHPVSLSLWSKPHRWDPVRTPATACGWPLGFALIPHTATRSSRSYHLLQAVPPFTVTKGQPASLTVACPCLPGLISRHAPLAHLCQPRRPACVSLYIPSAFPLSDFCVTAPSPDHLPGLLPSLGSNVILAETALTTISKRTAPRSPSPCSVITPGHCI